MSSHSVHMLLTYKRLPCLYLAAAAGVPCSGRRSAGVARSFRVRKQCKSCLEANGLCIATSGKYNEMMCGDLTGGRDIASHFHQVPIDKWRDHHATI